MTSSWPQRIATRLTAICALFSIAACGGGSGGTEGNPPGGLEDLTILPVYGPSTIVRPGTSFQLTLQDTLGDTVSIADVSWSSDNPSVVAVNATGWASAIADGTAIISASRQTDSIQQTFQVDSTAVVLGPDLLITSSSICTASAPLPTDCSPAWSPILDGSIGITGHDYLRVHPTYDGVPYGTISYFTDQDQLTVGPLGVAPCQVECVTIGVAPNLAIDPISLSSWCVDVFVPASDTVFWAGRLRSPNPGILRARWIRSPKFSNSPSWVVVRDFYVFVDRQGVSYGGTCAEVSGSAGAKQSVVPSSSH